MYDWKNTGMTKAEREEVRANESLLWTAFRETDLKRVCEASEFSFASAYGMDIFSVPDRKTDDYYLFRDNGSDILFVAHLDTVVWPEERGTSIVDTEGGLVVHSGALDDRLGAYVGLELLPRIGIRHDWLLTVGEESGRSTAEFFQPEKQYDWIIEFDRGGTDVVMYSFEDSDCASRVRKSGARVGKGIFTDICYLEHLKAKAFNWGVGYQDYHCTRGYAFLDDTIEMVAKYLRFHAANVGEYLPHEEKRFGRRRGGSVTVIGGGDGGYGGYGGMSDDEYWWAGKADDKPDPKDEKPDPSTASSAWTYDDDGNRVDVDPALWSLPGDGKWRWNGTKWVPLNEIENTELPAESPSFDSGVIEGTVHGGYQWTAEGWVPYEGDDPDAGRYKGYADDVAAVDELLGSGD